MTLSKKTVLSAVVIVVIAAIGLNARLNTVRGVYDRCTPVHDCKVSVVPPETIAADRDRFIAHAGGAVDGHIYTNSLEALDTNYRKGFRRFELDIRKSSDGIYVACHEWDEWKRRTGYTGTLPPSAEMFRRYRIDGRFTPLTMPQINRWFASHPDAVLVTDKIDEPRRFSNSFTDPGRLMMELFTQHSLEEGLSLPIRSAMPTWKLLVKMFRVETLFRLPTDKARTLKEMGVNAVAVSRTKIEDNRPFLAHLKQSGIHVYLFKINRPAAFDETYVVCRELDLAYGLYADRWDFNTSITCDKGNRRP